MKMIRGTLKLTLILYICAALSGVYVLSASARITPHADDDETMLITIEKGDTLWDLCQEHLKDPLRWRELSKYNDFTNPHLIYPGEKLRIPVAMAKNIVELAEDEEVVNSDELRKLKEAEESLRAMQEELEAAAEKARKKDEAYAAELAKLKADLEAATQAGKDISAFQREVRKEINKIQEEVGKDIAAFQRKVEEKSEETKVELASLEEKLKANQDLIVSIQADMAKLLKEIEMNRQGINQLNGLIMAAQGVHEKPSTTKRALVFLTTVAAGVGWFAINAIGGRSGE